MGRGRSFDRKVVNSQENGASGRDIVPSSEQKGIGNREQGTEEVVRSFLFPFFEWGGVEALTEK
jgi:hypothetical protein